ncbi:glycoside hydrolase family 16 protein [Geodermatophilus sp. CPCC 205506]|uniref:glycoside hydrolase family 16 protein n=1 Tax=Geodermatophilus sp. CPCC 205506 TaxID=2936596 RepID=UPI003EEABE55
MFLKFFLARRLLSACVITSAVGGGLVVSHEAVSVEQSSSAATAAPAETSARAVAGDRASRDSRESSWRLAQGATPTTPAPTQSTEVVPPPVETPAAETAERGSTSTGSAASAPSTSRSAAQTTQRPAPVPAPAPVAPPAPVVTSGSAVPAQDLPGWNLVLAEDFTRDAALGQFDSVYPGWSGYDGSQDTSGNGTYNSDAVVSVSGGVVDKNLHSGNGGAQVAALTPAIDGQAWDGQLYGRYSVRFRADDVPGYKIAWLLWPSNDDWSQGEIDFPEADLDSTISGFAHDVTGNPSRNAWHMNTGASMTDWHTATIEWTPDSVTFILDGQAQSTTDRSAIPTDPMRWVLQTETALDGGAPSSGAAGHVQVDWVAAWSRA